jgi:hypothetical protein
METKTGIYYNVETLRHDYSGEVFWLPDYVQTIDLWQAESYKLRLDEMGFKTRITKNTVTTTVEVVEWKY